MNTITDKSSKDHKLDEDRETLRDSLDQIAVELGSAMRDAGLNFPLGLTVPETGDALVSILTPGEPSAADWKSAAAIVHEIVSKRLGGIKLRNRELQCAMANATMTVADVTAG